MATKVVDTSAIASICFGEPDRDGVIRELQGCQLLAPALLPFELANVALQKIRRVPGEEAAVLAGFKLFESLDIALEEIGPLETIGMARRTGLTAYDAAYLLLAQQEKAPLVTLDLRQKSAILI